MSKTRTVSYWVLAVLLAFAFGAAGIMKLTANPMEVAGFQMFGYALWFMYLIGALEVLGAIGVLLGKIVHRGLPRLAAYGLIGIMIGALYSHATHPPVLAGIPAVILTILLIIFIRTSKKIEHAALVPVIVPGETAHTV